MKRKTIISFILSLVLLTGVGYGYATSAGSADDPLISLSFLRGDFLDNILYQAKSEISSALDDTYNVSSSGIASGSGDTGNFRAVNMNLGGEISLAFGGSAIVCSGSATLVVEKGEVINITEGITANNGNIKLGSRYFAADNTSASINFTADSYVLLDGDTTIVYGEGTSSAFFDISSKDWFYSDVMSAVEMGLINGMTNTTFVPNGNITKAQVIKLAACTHQKYHSGEVTLTNGSPWYKSYAEYALENDIITAEPEDYNSTASRSYYIAVMFNAMSDKEYEQINVISDNAVPDVKQTDEYYEQIYTFYRAGIVTGSDVKGTFNPTSEVKRSEVATLVARMFDPGVRKTVSLP